MSMTTTLKDKKSGKIVSFVTQQYVVGLYVALYTEGNSIPLQGSSRMKEIVYHKGLRKNHPDFIKDESDPLNRDEVRKMQIEFANQYARKRGWPIHTDGNFYRDLTQRQLKSITKHPEYKACLNNYKW